MIQNQGLQHIVEKSLMCLDKESFNSFRLVNNDFKEITESPRVLRVLKVRKLASVITGFLFNYENFNCHYNSKGRAEIIALNGDEWKKGLFKFLHDQSLNQVEVDHFKLLCKILDQNLFSLVDSLSEQHQTKHSRFSYKFKELSIGDQMRLVQNSWSGILILDQMHHRMHNHIPDEATLANGHSPNIDVNLVNQDNSLSVLFIGS